MPRDLTYLADILQAARLVLTFVENRTKAHFFADLMCQSAVIRQIEIIGEATKRLSEAFRNDHVEIPWHQMAGMRDVLIHAYDHVDLEEVWKTVKKDIPQLISMIEPLVPPEEKA
ncbi:DUF86 domain-containing protein [Candidatus Poribacteria bacterium]|nr:DUF86 domain-containing protein [Candidatus Poribacteria bacterium]